MTEIFFSYASQDRKIVSVVRELLIEEGFSIFWDQDISAGANWDDCIREKLSAAPAVVVFWSAHSVTSENVIHEASIAKKRGVLLPILITQIDPTKFPLGHYSVQTLSLLNSSPTREDIRPILAGLESRLMPPWMRRRLQDMEQALNSNVKIIEELKNREVFIE